MAKMCNYDQLLPDFEDLIQTKATEDKRAKKQKDIQTILSSSASSTGSSSSSSFSSFVSTRSDTNANQTGHLSLGQTTSNTSGNVEIGQKSLFELPPIINNSVVVRQKASAKDCLAAATVTTAASLPLMIGGRSKCVVNILPEVDAKESDKSGPPKNTALRAEQRKQNMVSIVRPVVNLNQNQLKRSQFELQASSQPLSQLGQRKRLEDSSIWEEAAYSINTKKSVIDELMSMEQSASRPPSNLNNVARFSVSPRQFNNLDDYNLVLSSTNNKLSCLQLCGSSDFDVEHQTRQQMLLYRREEYELNKSIRKHHRFVSMKIEDRKRNLLIIQSVWFQRDFKHAMEKLVDIYHQGLVFSAANSPANCDTTNRQVATISKLNSLNSSLVVDVLGVIVLRPQLWNLEVCQLLLPIIVNDLLGGDHQFEGYTEVALKALKLILTNFSPVIKSTLDSLKESISSVGIDLSREERITKCLNCYKLLLEAKAVVGKRCGSSINNIKFNSLYRELHQSFITLESSLDKAFKSHHSN